MITIYGARDCLACLNAKQLCEGYNFRHTFKDVKNDLDSHNEFMLKYPNETKLPVVEWHKRYIGGYEEFLTEIENTINNYGDGL